MTTLTADEREICVSQTDAERADGIWHVFTSSPYWIRRLDKFGELIREDGLGGKEYRLRQKQVLLRKQPKKRQMSDRQRKILAERLRA